MEKVKFKDIFSFEKKSKIKAGDGFKLGEGKYPFYTSSDTLSKTLNEFLFEKEIKEIIKQSKVYQSKK